MQSHTLHSEIKALTSCMCTQRKKKKKKNPHGAYNLAVSLVHSVITAAVKRLETGPDSQTAWEEVSEAAGTFTVWRPLHFYRAGRLLKLLQRAHLIPAHYFRLVLLL